MLSGAAQSGERVATARGSPRARPPREPSGPERHPARPHPPRRSSEELCPTGQGGAAPLGRSARRAQSWRRSPRAASRTWGRTADLRRILASRLVSSARRGSQPRSGSGPGLRCRPHSGECPLSHGAEHGSRRGGVQVHAIGWGNINPPACSRTPTWLRCSVRRCTSSGTFNSGSSCSTSADSRQKTLEEPDSAVAAMLAA